MLVHNTTPHILKIVHVSFWTIQYETFCKKTRQFSISISVSLVDKRISDGWNAIISVRIIFVIHSTRSHTFHLSGWVPIYFSFYKLFVLCPIILTNNIFCCFICTTEYATNWYTIGNTLLYITLKHVPVHTFANVSTYICHFGSDTQRRKKEAKDL